MHPYAWRTWLRRRLPRFLIDLGIAAKGTDCEALGAEHHWYSRDNASSGCYHCEVIRPGQLWRPLQSAAAAAPRPRSGAAGSGCRRDAPTHSHTHVGRREVRTTSSVTVIHETGAPPAALATERASFESTTTRRAVRQRSEQSPTAGASASGSPRPASPLRGPTDLPAATAQETTRSVCATFVRK